MRITDLYSHLTNIFHNIYHLKRKKNKKESLQIMVLACCPNHEKVQDCRDGKSKRLSETEWGSGRGVVQREWDEKEQRYGREGEVEREWDEKVLAKRVRWESMSTWVSEKGKQRMRLRCKPRVFRALGDLGWAFMCIYIYLGLFCIFCMAHFAYWVILFLVYIWIC